MLLEFNVRFGDPETQVMMNVIDGDLGEALDAAARGKLDPTLLRPSGEHAVCVVLAAAGYPGTPRGGDAISGIEQAEAIEGVAVYHAGTRLEGGRVVTSGGRVLGVTGRGLTLGRGARARIPRGRAHPFLGDAVSARHRCARTSRVDRVSEDLDRAALAALGRGSVVAAATETFFGLLVDATDSPRRSIDCFCSSRAATRRASRCSRRAGRSGARWCSMCPRLPSGWRRRSGQVR